MADKKDSKLNEKVVEKASKVDAKDQTKNTETAYPDKVKNDNSDKQKAEQKEVKPAPENNAKPQEVKKRSSVGKVVLIVGGLMAGFVLLLVSIGVTYLVTSKLEIDKCDSRCDTLDMDYQTCLDSLFDTQEDLAECEEGCDVDIPVCDCKDLEGPVQTIQIGDSGYLRIPSGWMLSAINSSFSYLTDEEEADMIKPENNGLWPIHESTTYEISVSKDTSSKLTIVDSALFVPGATGFMATELTEEFEEIADGAVRIYKNSEYRYLLVEENPDYNSSNPGLYSPDYEYVYLDIEQPLITYSGSDLYLDDADEIFIEACLRDSTKLCSGSAFE